MYIDKIKNKLITSSRLTKSIIVSFNDYLFFLFSALITVYLNPDVSFSYELESLIKYLYSPLIGVALLYTLGVYRSLVRFINFQAILELVRSLLIIALLQLLFFIFFKQFYHYLSDFLTFTDFLLGWLLAIVFIVGIRLLANSFFSNEISSSRVIIYGAGSAGIQLASALKFSSEMNPIAFVDKDESLQNSFVAGLKVISPESLEKRIIKKEIDEVLIAMPSAPRQVISELLTEIEKFSIKVRVLPGVAELAQGKVLVSELKEIQAEDLLNRERVLPDQDLLDKNIKGKVVMITGAGGSIGSEICRQVSLNDPSTLVLFDLNEFSLYSIHEELINKFPELSIKAILSNVTDEARVKAVCDSLKVETIYHAAAYKHVSLVEGNPFDGAFNNIFGTLSCSRAALKSGVKTFVLISTDKAVRPTNIMGASKRFSELILQSISGSKSFSDNTKFTMVRFGNVLGSSGSAVPLFHEQIRRGGPVTVTHPDVIRYFMTISEAAELVIQAGALGKGGDVFVLDMGEPVKILELAKRMIRLSGMEVQGEEYLEEGIEIVFTGLRPGEKLFEELLIGENVSTTKHKQIMRAEEEALSWKEVENYLEELKKAQNNFDHKKLIEIFKRAVSGYEPREGIQDVLYLSK